MLKVMNGNVYLTRGDSAKLDLVVDNYKRLPGDRLIFTVKQSTSSSKVLIQKQFDENMILELTPEDTKDLLYRNYVYDVQLTRNSYNDTLWVETVITPHKFIVTEEVSY